MPALLDPPRPAATTSPQPKSGTSAGWRVFALVGLGLAIFAHGCHGADEDHELFARVRARILEFVNSQ